MAILGHCLPLLFANNIRILYTMIYFYYHSRNKVYKLLTYKHLKYERADKMMTFEKVLEAVSYTHLV